MRCSFCHLLSAEVYRIIAGPNLYICNECVQICVDILLDEGWHLKLTEPYHMNDSVFNVDTFLDQSTTEQGTRRPPINSSLEFLGTIGEPKARNVPGKKDPNATYTFCDIPITLDLTTHPSEVARVGVEKVTLRHSISLDYTPSGALDWSPGRNRGLTAYREALGLNKPGQTFSPRMLVGRIVKARVGHRQGTEIDPATGRTEIYDEISAVTRP